MANYENPRATFFCFFGLFLQVFFISILMGLRGSENGVFWAVTPNSFFLGPRGVHIGGSI